MRRIAAYLMTASLAPAARADGVDSAERLNIAGLSLGVEMRLRYEREAARLDDLCREWQSYPEHEEERLACLRST